MKLSFNKDNLMNGINIVLKAVSSKTTMPILECILIDATSNEIKLTGNDMELGIETKVEGMILERGKIALDAKLLSDIIRKLSGDESLITIESDEKFNTVITCEKSVFKIQGKDGEEFSRYIIIGRRFRKQNSCMCYYLSHDFIIRLERLLYVKIVLKK